MALAVGSKRSHHHRFDSAEHARTIRHAAFVHNGAVASCLVMALRVSLSWATLTAELGGGSDGVCGTSLSSSSSADGDTGRRGGSLHQLTEILAVVVGLFTR